VKVAITGGTGFVGRHLARALSSDGHELAIIARGCDRTDPEARVLPHSRFWPVQLENFLALTEAFAGCETVVHCAGINRELGDQTYRRVHVEGTHNIVKAARAAGVRKIILLSFLRARPNCGSGYHESKWAAEEIVRASGLDYTVLRCGVIYGQGDHMLNHLSHAFFTFPIFAFVGFKDQFVRPNAIEDVVRILKASALNGALSRQTVAILGPETLTLRQAVRRVAEVVGRCPLMFPLPVWFHYTLGWVLARIMTVPLVSVAQVRMLSEGLAEPALPCDPLPSELAPRIPFTREQIQKGLPVPARFGLRDLRCCSARADRSATKGSRADRVFFQMP
jgi:nucleoside-diphosphate-sugar epimerase